jgi:hypothetical protein
MAHFDPLLERDRHFATTDARMSTQGRGRQPGRTPDV